MCVVKQGNLASLFIQIWKLTSLDG